MRREIHWSRVDIGFFRVNWVLAGLAICGLLAAHMIPIQIVDHAKSVCLFKLLTGKECPGCGMTRAFFHLLHLDFTVALQQNRLCIIVVPLLAYILFGKVVVKRTE